MKPEREIRGREIARKIEKKRNEIERERERERDR